MSMNWSNKAPLCCLVVRPVLPLWLLPPALLKLTTLAMQQDRSLLAKVLDGNRDLLREVLENEGSDGDGAASAAASGAAEQIADIKASLDYVWILTAAALLRV